MSRTRFCIIILLLLTLCACHPAPQTRPAAIYTPEAFLKDAADITLSTQQILEKYLPGILVAAQSDTATLFYGSNELTDDSSVRQLLVGRPFDKTHIVAIAPDLRDRSITFYLLDTKTWRRIGREQMSFLTCTISFTDLDGDGKNEVVTSTCNNMNGNSWKEIFFFSDRTQTVHYAGSFSTDYKVREGKRQLEETYQGSWYADQSKTLYEWRSEMLIPVKRIVLARAETARERDRMVMEYYEAGTNDRDSLRLKSRETWHETKPQQYAWDNFLK